MCGNWLVIVWSWCGRVGVCIYWVGNWIIVGFIMFGYWGL